jgi:Protein of unknown function (DUF4240)
MNTQRFWQLIEGARAQVSDPTDDEVVAAEAATLLAALPREEIVAAQRVLLGLMADSYRTALWAAAYVINGGCSNDGFDYFRGWLIVQGRHVFEPAVADPHALADLAVIQSAPRRPFLECESVLYIPAKAHRAATGEELPADAYTPGPREPVGGWDFDFDDQLEMKRRLPRLTRLCWPDEIQPLPVQRRSR